MSYDNLKLALRKNSGIQVSYADDCKALASWIQDRTKRNIGYNTLRRFYGFEPQRRCQDSTLDQLAQAAGYDSYAVFCAMYSGPPDHKPEVSVVNEVSIPDLPHRESDFRLCLQEIRWLDFDGKTWLTAYRFIWRDGDGYMIHFQEGAFLHNPQMLYELTALAQQAGWWPAPQQL